MIKIKRINESLDIDKIEPPTITFKVFKLKKMLSGLERERPGIYQRVYDFIYDERDPYFLPQDVRGLHLGGRLYSLNLFYYGVGDEYPIKEVTKEELEHSRRTFPESFIDGKNKEIRLDFNLIWSVYEEEIDDDPENFLITV